MPARPLPSETAATLSVIESLHGTIAMARALVLSGREVDLTGLDREAERLCAAVACLGEGTRSFLGAPLAELASELESLSLVMPRP